MNPESAGLLWAVFGAAIVAAIAWGKTQADMSAVKREIRAVRRLERKVTRLSTLIEVRFGVRAEPEDDDEDEDTRL